MQKSSSASRSPEPLKFFIADFFYCSVFPSNLQVCVCWNKLAEWCF